MTSPTPTATYRLQFRAGMTFSRAAELVPYFRNLGVSHLYASPIFQATSGSTHGYDVTDPNAFDTELGGREGFLLLSDALREAGLGLILDIVPNHMAFSLENPWLRDVLRKGRGSRYARHFDIDWSRGRLVLPWLGKPFASLNAEGAFHVDGSGSDASLAWEGMAVPLRADGPTEAKDPDAIAALHEAQHWRLADWRLERDGLTHRRFFNITSLIGVRVEDPQVFEDAHRLLFEMVDEGRVQGIRIDHIDGLADPAGYLDRLAARVGAVPLWVEKILTGDEALPDWPVAGTTGYEAGAAIAQVLTCSEGVAAIDAAYAEFVGEKVDFETLLLKAKHEILGNELAAERLALTQLLIACAEADPVARDFGPDTLARAVIALCAAFPVYRTYLTGETVGATDASVLEHAAKAAGRRTERAAVDFLVTQLEAGKGPQADRLRVRFQQVTGALMAKSKEDTAFYRYNRLLSSNDVGAEPEAPALPVDAFHAAMDQRLRTQPQGLTLTSSHDTKRSEDARMRIAAITHDPEAFVDLMRKLDGVTGAEALPPHVRWYIGQSLLAVWGSDQNIETRLQQHMEKALREGKEFTTWTQQDTGFEGRVLEFVAAAIRHCEREPAPQLAALIDRAAPLILTQAGLKMLMPGIADIYQGCETLDYSLTDPDNRRPVDFAALSTLSKGAAEEAADDRLAVRKNSLLRVCLRLRAEEPELFAAGDYRPLNLPKGLAGFRRSHGTATVALICRIGPVAAGDAIPLAEAHGLELYWGDPGAWDAAGSLDLAALERVPVLVLARRS